MKRLPLILVLAASLAACGGESITPEQLAAMEKRATTAERAAEIARSDATRAEGAMRAARAQAEADVAEKAKAAEDADKARDEALRVKEAALAEREKAVGIAEAEAEANTFDGDGIFIVGDDIKPGTYKSAGGNGCYWGRQDKGGETIDNNIGDGPTVVTIKSSDYAIRVSRCAPFTLVK